MAQCEKDKPKALLHLYVALLIQVSSSACSSYGWVMHFRKLQLFFKYTLLLSKLQADSIDSCLEQELVTFSQERHICFSVVDLFL